MTVFLTVAGLMVLVALAWLLPTLLRSRGAGVGATQAASNLSILRDQLAELERDVARGTLSSAHYQQARDDLDRHVLDELAEAAPAIAMPGSARRTALVLGIVLPLCAALLYWQLGSPAGMEGVAVSHAEKFSPQQVEGMVGKLSARLAQSPEDGEGWALLGRSYMMMKRFPDAVKAYERATSLIKDNADLFADYADALAMTQDRRIEGKPLQLIELALRVDPGHWKALAMAGSAAFDRKDYKSAVHYWETLLARIGPESEFARNVASNIEEARQLGGIKTPRLAKKEPAKEAAKSLAGGAVVRGTVNISAALKAKADPSDTVFVFARAAQGPRMPLALVRKQVKDLPFSFTLDDSQAMSPETTLSKFSEVIVGARISKAGSATPQSGDMQGYTQKIRTGGAPVNVVIDQVVP